MPHHFAQRRSREAQETVLWTRGKTPIVWNFLGTDPTTITANEVEPGDFALNELESAWIWTGLNWDLIDSAGVIDHGALTGLTDDDHTIYLLADGSRALTANWAPGAFDIGNYDFTAKVELLEIDDSNFALDIISSDPRITFDSGDYISYARSTNNYLWFIGSSEKMALDSGKVQFKVPVNLDVSVITISSGSITPTRSAHVLAGEGGADDDLDAIAGGEAGDILVLSGGAQTMTVTHATPPTSTRIILSESVRLILNDATEALTLMYFGSSIGWVETNRSKRYTAISDSDGDTLVLTENSTDEDIIRFKADGSEKLTIDSTRTIFARTGFVNFDSSQLTISSGVVTPTGSYHSIDTEADAASDELDGITATAANIGDFLLIHPDNSSRKIVVKHQTGVNQAKITVPDGRDFTLDSVNDFAYLVQTGFGATGWVVLYKPGNKNALLVDDDGDTKIDVEESADEDIIRFYTASTQRLAIGATGVFTFAASAVVDLGASTSLEIPNSATPTVNADGEIALDTTVTDFSHGIIKYYGGEEMGVVAMPIAQFTSPTDNYVVTYNAATDEFELQAGGGGGDHGALGGLGDDDHSQYALLAGRAGGGAIGQTLIGGTDMDDSLVLKASSHATPGDMVLRDHSLLSIFSTVSQHFWTAGVERIVVRADGEVQLLTTGSAAGIQIGGDTKLYRATANLLTLESGDAFNILGGAGDFGAPANGTLWYNTTTGKFRVYESDAWADMVGGGGGSGTMTTVKEDNVQVGDADIVTLDFTAPFEVAETPDTEVQITLNEDAAPLGNPFRTVILFARQVTITAGADGPVTVETSTNKNNYTVVDFDNAADEHVFWEVPLPGNWDGGTVTFHVHWTTTNTGTEGIAFALKAYSYGDGEALDAAWGTAVVVTDDNQSAAGLELRTAESGDLTIGGTPAGGERVLFDGFRDVSDANDDMTEDMRVSHVCVTYKTGTYSD
jgi:hypothetical protein